MRLLVLKLVAVLVVKMVGGSGDLEGLDVFGLAEFIFCILVADSGRLWSIGFGRIFLDIK